MDHLTDAVRQAIKQENWYAALGLALTLPDICGRIESPEQSSKARYVAWCNRYLSPHYTLGASQSDPSAHVILHGDDCYALRCAVLHEGADDIVEQHARRALESFRFLAPEGNTRVVFNLNRARLQLHVDWFCEAICDGVDEWSRQVLPNTEAAARIQALMKVHRGGVTIQT